MMEDWADDIDLTTDQADHLNRLDDLRVEDPILWAMVCGVRTSRSISGRITWPHDYTLFKLREYKRDYRVIDTEGKRSVEWHFSEVEDELRELARWVHANKGTGGLFLPDENDE
jgi:hypothetical protein